MCVCVCGVQRVMLTEAHLARLKADTGIEPWSFEQHSDEAVFIPAGCPHQVRKQPLTAFSALTNTGGIPRSCPLAHPAA